MYGNLIDFKSYCATVGYDISSYTDDKLNQSLNIASKKIDSKFRQKWIGSRATSSQVEDWPRINAYGSISGASYPSSSVPTAINESTYEFAFYVASGVVTGVVGDSNQATIKKEKSSLTSGMFEEIEYTSGLSPEDRENQVYSSLTELWLFDLLKINKTGGFTTGRCL